MNDSGIPNPAGGANLPIINPNAPTGATNGINPTDLMGEITSRLMGATGIISSNNSKIEDVISGAIAKTEQAGVAAKKGTESAFNREIATATEKAAIAEQGFLESQRGFATNTAALKDLRATTEKGIKDLVQRKEEVMLQGDVATASKISDLILKKYEFEQNATQQWFNNLTTMFNIGLNKAQEDRLNKTQQFTEDSAKSNIALKYGIEVKAGDTFQDVVNRAKPFASKEQQLELDKMNAEIKLVNANIAKANAEATKALKDSKATDPLDDASIRVIAQNLKDGGQTANAIKAQLATSAGVKDKSIAYAIVDELFTPKTTPAKASNIPSWAGSGAFASPLVNDLADLGGGIKGIGKSITDYIFGK